VSLTKFRAIAASSFALLLLPASARQAMAQDVATRYSSMAPIAQYLMADQAAEIALARSAAPEPISRRAEILVLGRHGYTTAVRGSNGFVCIVGRGWSYAADPDFWNPKVRVPICVNAPAARTYLVRIRKIADLALAGRSLDQVNAAMAAALARKQLAPMAPGAMAYMMSRQGYGGDVVPHLRSHLMFFFSDADPAMWGANLPGAPVSAVADPVEHVTEFFIATPRWSDGTENRSGPAAPSGGTAAPRHEHP